MPIGQVVAAQGLGLSSACEQLARKADADDVAEQLEQGRRDTQARFEEVSSSSSRHSRQPREGAALAVKRCVLLWPVCC